MVKLAVKNFPDSQSICPGAWTLTNPCKFANFFFLRFGGRREGGLFCEFFNYEDSMLDLSLQLMIIRKNCQK